MARGIIKAILRGGPHYGERFEALPDAETVCIPAIPLLGPSSVAESVAQEPQSVEVHRYRKTRLSFGGRRVFEYVGGQ